MDQTAIQPGAPTAKPAATAIQAGIPSANGAALDEPPAIPAPVAQNMTVARQILHRLADLRITVVLFSLAMLVVFWGTLAQVDNGVWTVVRNYFRSFLAWVPMKVILFNSVEWHDPIPFPGGWLIGSVMMVNLLAAHAMRFKLSWARSGILLIHAGLIIMMLGEVVTGVYQVEGNMIIKVGGSSHTVIHPGQIEFAAIRTLDAKTDDVVTVPGRLLTKPDAVVDTLELPFKIEVVDYMVNSNIIIEPNKIANRGLGRRHKAIALKEGAGVDANAKHDQPSAYVKLVSRQGEDLGTWLLSTLYDDPQWLTIDGKQYQLFLRFKHTGRDFDMHLTKFTHDVYPGTMTPKDFHSYIELSDNENNVDRRKVEIFMNSPLYYRGETFYQSSWTNDFTGKANGTILQVVRNPGWLMPYISCLVVGVGLLFHFGLTLCRFVIKRTATA